MVKKTGLGILTSDSPILTLFNNRKLLY